MKRFRGNVNGERYLGNTESKEVHDLDNEDTNTNGCQIDEIIDAEHDKPFSTLSSALDEGFNKCAKCF